MLQAAPLPLVSIHTTSPAVVHFGVAAWPAAAPEAVVASAAAGISAAETATAITPASRLGKEESYGVQEAWGLEFP